MDCRASPPADAQEPAAKLNIHKYARPDVKKISVSKQDSVKLYKIRRILEEISEISGHGTELISLYIPKGRQLHEVIGTLKEEQGTASNIKSDFTRNHVLESLGKVIQRLKLYKKTPERGLVVFCGALPPEGGGPIGSEVVRAFEIDPPKDLSTYLYRCDNHFHVEILKGMLKDDNLIGFLALDAKDAGWGLLRGDKIDFLKDTSSGVAGKHRQGGQSAKRFQRLREMDLMYYYNRVAEITREYFIDIHPIKGLIVSGPGPTKEDFIKGGYLEYRLYDMIIATLDSSYAGREGIREAFAKSSEILSDFRMVEEKRIVDKLITEINSRSGLGAYGLRDVIDLLKKNVVETLVITDDIGMQRIESTCNRCGHSREEMAARRDAIARKATLAGSPCPGCDSSDIAVSSKEIVDYLALIAAGMGSRVEVISGKAEHGAALSSLGKIGALLRYNPGHSAA